MSHTGNREANILGALSVAVADRARVDSGGAALLALHTWLAGASIDGLARVLALSHSGTVRLVDRLAGDGLIERRASDDARAVSLWLSEAGHEKAGRLQAERASTLDAVLAPLEAPERALLVELLGRLLGGLVSDHAGAGNVCRMCDPDACGHPETCPVTLAVAP